jgi:hypothetical protein
MRRAAPVLLLLTLAIAPAVFWRGGLIEREATVFVPHYLDPGRSLARKVFDPAVNDRNTYQSRELSHLFDALDASVLAVAWQGGVLLLVPFSAWASLVLTAVIWRRGAARVMPGLDPLTAALVLALYMSSFVCLSTMGVHYRSTKALLVPALLGVLFTLVDVVRRPRPPGSDARLPALCAACVTLGVLDRHGFLEVLAAAAVLGAYAWRRAELRPAWRALAAAAGLLVLHTLLVAPLLTRALNGYWPGLRFQASPPFAVLRHPQRLVEAAEVLAQQVGLLLGGVPCWAWLALLAAALAWAGRRGLRSRSVIALIALVAASQVATYALMIARHSALYRLPDHRLWYYPLPLVALLCFGILLAAEWLALRLPPKGGAVLAASLIALTIANAVQWTSHHRAMQPWLPGIEWQSTLLRRSLEQGTPAAGLDPDYRRFLRFLLTFRPARPEANVAPIGSE